MHMLALFHVLILFLTTTNAAVTQLPMKEIPQPKEFPSPTTDADINIPVHFDWREKGAVTKVKDQGNCALSDWAFVATGALEAQLFRANLSLIELSVQQLIDCSAGYANHGCEGGNPTAAFRYIEEHGIVSEQSYPHMGEEFECADNLTENRIVENSRIEVEKIITKDEIEISMKREVYTKGPILAKVDVPESFENYKGGIYDNEECTKNGTETHYVLIVGYGVTEESQEYWIVKNSWGESWGEKGYIRIARNKNMCGIAKNAFYLVTDFN